MYILFGVLVEGDHIEFYRQCEKKTEFVVYHAALIAECG